MFPFRTNSIHCMLYLQYLHLGRFLYDFMINVAKYTIHWSYGQPTLNDVHRLSSFTKATSVWHSHWKFMIGRWISFWASAAMWVLGTVIDKDTVIFYFQWWQRDGKGIAWGSPSLKKPTLILVGAASQVIKASTNFHPSVAAKLLVDDLSTRNEGAYRWQASVKELPDVQ